MIPDGMFVADVVGPLPEDLREPARVLLRFFAENAQTDRDKWTTTGLASRTGLDPGDVEDLMGYFEHCGVTKRLGNVQNN